MERPVEKATEVITDALSRVDLVHDLNTERGVERLEALGNLINGAAAVLAADAQYSQAKAIREQAQAARELNEAFRNKIF